jgi:uncharacterized protein YkwD
MAGLVLAPTVTLARFSPVVASETAEAPESPWIDTSDRAEVLEGYVTEFDRVEPDSGYDGDAANCVAGSTSQQYRDSIVARVNWYRRMAGLAPVVERADYSEAAQDVSMMMSAAGAVSHAPDTEWPCSTPAGRTAAPKSNLALGISGLDAIDAYVRDPGSNNFAVGHRRTILYPQLLEIGTGDVETENGNWAGNTLWVFDDNLWNARPQVREARGFVAWPPAGYVPAETAWGRWSFSLPGGDFRAATVRVTDSLGAVQTTVLDRIQADIPNSLIAPEPSIVWAIGDDTNSMPLPAPSNGDECYEVTIGGVAVDGVVQPDFTYRTCVIDPDFDPATAPSSATPGAAPVPSADCGGIEFGVWTVPCWTGDATLGGFTDVVTDWQRDPIAWLVGNGITTGISPTRFEPSAPLTRAQAATLIWRTVGSPAPPTDAPSFVDVPDGVYYRDAVRWMARYGITTGTGGDRFSPDAAATRAEFVTLLWRVVDKPAVNDTVSFVDLTAPWQVAPVRWAATAGITTGTSTTTFSPDLAVTRGEAAALLARFGDAIS